MSLPFASASVKNNPLFCAVPVGALASAVLHLAWPGAASKRGEIAPDDKVNGLAAPIPFVLTPDMSLAMALDGFLREQVKTLPVTAGQWHTTLLGEVSRHDLLLAVQDRIAGKG